MSTLREQQAPHLAAAFSPEQFGQVVTYNGQDINAIFKSGSNPDFSHSGSRVSASANTGRLQVMKSDVATWEYNDEVMIQGQTWRVKRQLDGSTWFKHVLQIETDRRKKP